MLDRTYIACKVLLIVSPKTHRSIISHLSTWKALSLFPPGCYVFSLITFFLGKMLHFVSNSCMSSFFPVTFCPITIFLYLPTACSITPWERNTHWEIINISVCKLQDFSVKSIPRILRFLKITVPAMAWKKIVLSLLDRKNNPDPEQNGGPPHSPKIPKGPSLKKRLVFISTVLINARVKGYSDCFRGLVYLASHAVQATAS